MPIQIANPAVVAKIEQLAAETGLSKTAAVEKAVDAMLSRRPDDVKRHTMDRFNAILAQFDRLPREPAEREAIEWDEHGLPK